MDRLLSNEEQAETSAEETCSKLDHFLSVAITAVSNFSVQYNFQSISIALIVMSTSVCTLSDDECKDGNQDGWVTSTATATVFIGAILGQLTMGFLGDVIGRTSAMTVTLSIVCLSATLSAVVPSGNPVNIYSIIIVARFFLGIGVGGIYPLSAIKAAEDGGKGGDSVDVASAAYAFFWQVPGAMTPWFFAMVFSYSSMTADMQWRLLLGLGAVPSAFVVLCSILENHQSKKKQMIDNDRCGTVHRQGQSTDELMESAKSRLIGDILTQRETWINLMVTGGCWFLYDVAYYGLELFGGEVLKSIDDSGDDDVSSSISIRKVSQQQLIALSTGIPACILSIVHLKYRSVKELQVYGFLLIVFFFVLLAALYSPLQHGSSKNTDALFSIYCLLLFALSYGPNISTYILPALIYPKEVRTTFNGISAACGKLGAFTGVYLFVPVAQATSYPIVMVICGILCTIGAIISQLYIKTNDYLPLSSKVFEVGRMNDDNVARCYD